MTPERKVELLHKAAQCWCDPRTSHLVTETVLAHVFQEALIEIERETWLAAAKQATNGASLWHAGMKAREGAALEEFADWCRQQAEAAR